MAECHAKKAREKIAEKKAEGNAKKLDKLVNDRDVNRDIFSRRLIV